MSVHPEKEKILDSFCISTKQPITEHTWDSWTDDGRPDQHGWYGSIFEHKQKNSLITFMLHLFHKVYVHINKNIYIFILQTTKYVPSCEAYI